MSAATGVFRAAEGLPKSYRAEPCGSGRGPEIRRRLPGGARLSRPPPGMSGEPQGPKSRGVAGTARACRARVSGRPLSLSGGRKRAGGQACGRDKDSSGGRAPAGGGNFSRAAAGARGSVRQRRQARPGQAWPGGRAGRGSPGESLVREGIEERPAVCAVAGVVGRGEPFARGNAFRDDVGAPELQDNAFLDNHAPHVEGEQAAVGA